MKTIGKHICVFILVLSGYLATIAQHVGIGTNNPSRELSVNGSVIIDNDSLNQGNLGGPGLLFGASGLTGITSSFASLQDDYHGMNFWTSGNKRMTIHANGNIGIGLQYPFFKLDVDGSFRSTSMFAANTITANGNIQSNDYIVGNDGVRAGGGIFDPAYKLQVNGHSFFNGQGNFAQHLHVDGYIQTSSNLFVTGFSVMDSYLAVDGQVYANGNMRVFDNMAVGGNVDNNYRLRVYDGNARIGGDFHATGNAAIGGTVDNAWRLRVYGGNSRFGGDVQVTGELTTTDLDVANNFTINGAGSVRSNGPSPLKISFHSKYINAYVYGGSTYDLTVNLPDFDDIDDIRVVISQFMPDPGDGGDYWDRMTFQPHIVNDVQNTCVIGVQNPHTASYIKGTLYYMVVMKDN